MLSEVLGLKPWKSEIRMRQLPARGQFVNPLSPGDAAEISSQVTRVLIFVVDFSVPIH